MRFATLGGTSLASCWRARTRTGCIPVGSFSSSYPPRLSRQNSVKIVLFSVTVIRRSTSAWRVASPCASDAARIDEVTTTRLSRTMRVIWPSPGTNMIETVQFTPTTRLRAAFVLGIRIGDSKERKSRRACASSGEVHLEVANQFVHCRDAETDPLESGRPRQIKSPSCYSSAVSEAGRIHVHKPSWISRFRNCRLNGHWPECARPQRARQS